MAVRNLVLTLGMHRSGTSVITRALEVLGVELGKNLMPAAEGNNEKGFFEDIEIMQANVSVMSALGLEWHSLEQPDWNAFEQVWSPKFTAPAEEMVNAKLTAHSCFGAKDPRLCRTLPFWKQVLQRMRVETYGVLAIRHPASVAASLAKRDGLPLVKSYYLWLLHIVESFKNSEWMSRRVVVDYDFVLDSPAKQLHRISNYLGLEVQEDKLAHFESDFLDPDLNHFAGKNDDVEATPPLLVKDTYRLLKRVARGDIEIDSLQFREEFKAIERRFADVIPLLTYCSQLENRRSEVGAGYAKTRISPIGKVAAEEGNFKSCYESGNSWCDSRLIADPIARQLVIRAAQVSICLVLIDDILDIEKLRVSLRAFNTARQSLPALSCIVLTLDKGIYKKTEFINVEFIEFPRGNLVNTINSVINHSTNADWVVFAQPPTEILTTGFLPLSVELSQAPSQLDAVYGDELLQKNGSEPEGAYFRPGMNLDMLLSSPADMSRHWLFRRSSILEAGGFLEDGNLAFELDYILKLVETKGFGCIGRKDEPLFRLYSGVHSYDLAQYVPAIENHLHRRGYSDSAVKQGLVQNVLHINYAHKDTPLVSIIIPTKDQLHLLQTCVESILEKTAYSNYEILVVDNNSETPEAQAWLRGLEDMGLPNIRVLRYHEAFNFSAINNYAAGEARGDYLLLLNNDTGIISSNWLDELLNHGQRPEVGIVGAKLLFPSGKIQHAGVIVGMRGPAEHICNGSASDDRGYMNRLMVDQNFSAVTAACMLVRKSVYEEVGGLDNDLFAVSYNDIDFCLKVAQSGYLTVWTPHALVMHVANASQTTVDKTVQQKKVARFRREQEAMYEKWLPYMGSDPAFNRNLSLRSVDYEVEPRAELNWQPQKLLSLPTVLVHPADQWGCGHYRIMQPLESMKTQAVAGGMIAKEWLTVPEMARLDPDSFVYQRQITPEAVENMKYARRFLKKPIVYELDDYLPNLPIKSAYRKNMPKDILKSLRASLKHVDRFVVSTHPLADAFKGAHPDIRVVENRLPLDWWSDLSAARRQSERPRVGWAGGVGHTGDLELVEAVVRDLTDEVDWVFFGMCPEGLRPYVKEVHEGVNIELYPEKLASMNLDLAIAPLEDNLFNRCKSNLRLLEYGACGFPVVCSDVEPYRAHELPVTRVKNRYKDWVDAIRMHLSDLDETARIGDELREVVCRDWMLEGENLQEWLGAWTKF